VRIYIPVEGLYPLLLCALRTGLRFGKLLGLQWDDVDERGRFIEVRRTLRDGQEHRRVALPKNGRIRRVDLSVSWPRSSVVSARSVAGKLWPVVGAPCPGYSSRARGGHCLRPTLRAASSIRS
jgi:integrase